MGRSRGRRRVPTADTTLVRQLAEARNNAELAERRMIDAAPLQESVGDLERALLGDPGWQRFTAVTQQEFTGEGMRQMRAVCRLMAIANPLIRRGLNLRSAYVWGQGVEITARANGQRDGEQDVQSVVAAFLRDDANARAFTGASARDRLEHALGTDGEFFVVLFTRPRSGWVQARVIVADEISDIICNPEDRSEPWFYRRTWTEVSYDEHGVQEPRQREQLYPAVDYRPVMRPKRYAGLDVDWHAPILHVDVNRPEGWQRGIPDAYAAVNWARAYKEFLENWATLMKSLARFAWRLTAKGSQRGQAKARLAAPPPVDSAGSPQDVGGVALTPIEQQLEAIPKSGATIDAESGRPLAMMVSSALDVPVTMLLSDPGQTGARATAETLDQPTELAMGQRRELWSQVMLRVLRYVIAEQVRAPHGGLQGTVKRDPVTGREVVRLAGDTSDVIDVSWPDLDDTDPVKVVAAIKAASETGTVPPELVLRLLLTALGVRDVDGIVQPMLDDEGGFVWPRGPGEVDGPASYGRAGADPALSGVGSMRPDGWDENADCGCEPDTGGDTDLDDGDGGGLEEDAGLTVPNVLLDLREAMSDRNLRKYWLHGKGALKIRWNTGGDFTRCVRQLGKHVADPKGLCAVYHKQATGVWPGDKRNR